MRLEQNQEQTLVQVLKMKLVYSCLAIILVIASISLVCSNPIKNYIRSYKPLPHLEHK